MNLSRWARMRKARRRRQLIAELRRANRSLADGYEGLKNIRDYQPVCMGGMEDKYEGERQWQNTIAYWSQEIRRLSRKLGITHKQAMRYA